MLRTCRYQPCCTFTYFWHGVSDIHLVAQFQPRARKPETIHFDFRLCRLRSKRHDQPKRSIIMSRRGRQVGSRRTVQKSEWRSDPVLASSQSRSHARCLAPFLPSLAASRHRRNRSRPTVTRLSKFLSYLYKTRFVQQVTCSSRRGRSWTKVFGTGDSRILILASSDQIAAHRIIWWRTIGALTRFLHHAPGPYNTMTLLYYH